MNTFEKKVLDKIEEYLPQIVFAVVTIIGFFIRYQLRTIVSTDAHTCLMPWYHEIADNGLYEQVGDYGLLYQFMIWIMTRPKIGLHSGNGISACMALCLAAFC